jgi:hypothetical protein
MPILLAAAREIRMLIRGYSQVTKKKPMIYMQLVGQKTGNAHKNQRFSAAGQH